MKMRRFIYSILSILVSILPVQAQQWVLDEIAEEQNESERLPLWAIIIMIIIGVIIYKHYCHTETIREEKRAKERKVEEQQQILEENDAYQPEYKEYEEPDIENENIHFLPQFQSQNTNSIPQDSCSSYEEHKTPRSQEKEELSIKQDIRIETDSYILSSNGKELIKGKDATVINIPEGVETIREQAFSGRQIESVIFPKSLKAIGWGAFSGCTIKHVEIPATIEYFGELVFQGCDSLKEVKIENGIKRLGNGMFSTCIRLENVSLPQNILSLPESIFEDCFSLKAITLPLTLKRIQNRAFLNCQTLQSISIPDTVEYIGIDAFSWCYELKEIVIPSGIVGIPDGAFGDDYNLREVVLPEHLAYIMKGAFSGCEHLHVRIPQSVIYIDPKAFSQCNELSYDALHIEVPIGKKNILEGLHSQLKGKITEYIPNNSHIDSEQFSQKRQYFIYQLKLERGESIDGMCTERGFYYRPDEPSPYANFQC